MLEIPLEIPFSINDPLILGLSILIQTEPQSIWLLSICHRFVFWSINLSSFPPLIPLNWFHSDLKHGFILPSILSQSLTDPRPLWQERKLRTRHGKCLWWPGPHLAQQRRHIPRLERGHNVCWRHRHSRRSIPDRSNFSSPGNLEVIFNEGGTLLHFYRETKDLKWNGPTAKVSPDLKAAGTPSFVQGTFAKRGNFELVSPVASGGLVHYWRNNDEANFPWSPPTFFGKEVGAFTSVSLIQSNYNQHLEVIAIANGKLFFAWRDDGFKWTPILPILKDYTVTGNPALIQSTFGKKGNFELFVAAASGGLFHFWKDNNDGTKPSPWSKAVLFAQTEGFFRKVSLIQSNYGDGNLEVVAEKMACCFITRVLVANGMAQIRLLPREELGEDGWRYAEVDMPTWYVLICWQPFDFSFGNEDKLIWSTMRNFFFSSLEQLLRVTSWSKVPYVHSPLRGLFFFLSFMARVTPPLHNLILSYII